MTEAAASPATAPATAATPAGVPDAASVPRNPDGTVDVTQFAAIANAALAEEAEAEAAAKPKEPAAKPAKERTEDGKFKKAEEPTKEEQATAPKQTASMQVLHRLFREGKLEEWLQAATGQEGASLDSVHIPSRALAHARRDLAQAKQVHQQTQQQIAQVQQRFAPVNRAMQLRDSGDIRGAIEAFFGKPLEDVQGEVVASYHKTDPQVAKLRSELAERDRRQAELAQQQQAEAQRQQLQQRQAEERKTLEGWLAESEDTRIANVAGKRLFVDAVIAKARETYAATKIFPSWTDMAREAYEDLYGDSSAEPAPRRERTDRRPDTSAKSDRRPDTTVKRANLSPERSADSAPLDMPEPGSPEMVQYWARRGMSEIHAKH